AARRIVPWRQSLLARAGRIRPSQSPNLTRPRRRTGSRKSGSRRRPPVAPDRPPSLLADVPPPVRVGDRRRVGVARPLAIDMADVVVEEFPLPARRRRLHRL